MLEAIRKIVGTKQDRDIRLMRPTIKAIHELGEHYQKMTDGDLQAQTDQFRERIQKGEALEKLLPEAFAVVREASTRVLKMRHFDVQIMGGIVMFQGKIAEMKTGEGKTLTATLALYLKALEGKGAHLVTVNDYLASRDAKEMGVLFNWLGLSVGVIVNDLADEERKNAYKADITYGTNNEFAFDYLRDNMKFDLDHYVQREHHFCIVDEVDSILIDEARTPLLISGPSEGNTEIYSVVDQIVNKLTAEEDFQIDEKSRSVIPTDAGVNKVQSLLKVENLFDPRHMELFHCLNQALKAHSLFKKDVDYVVKDNRVIIVDEFTGRLKEGSRWSDGLHQAVEAKEKVQVRSENQTLASITFQNYFRLYDRLSGMTGTADTEAEEFRKIYDLEVVVVPTNEPMVRADMADIVYPSKKAKYKAISEKIAELHGEGQPVLVGTISIDSSEVISKYLTEKKVPHEVLNAKQHEREAEIVAKAGEQSSVTIATNMAGRGTDIKLTAGTKERGGLFILGTERHESRRIDNQLRGRSGRQGDPGGSRFFISLEDDLMRIFGSDKIRAIMARFGMEDEEPIESKIISNQIAKAQKRVEEQNFEMRKHLLDFDNVMNEQRQVIYSMRKAILSDRENRELIDEMIEDVCGFLVEQNRPERKTPVIDWPWEDIAKGFHNFFQNSNDVLSGEECQEKFPEHPEKYLCSKAKMLLDKKFEGHDPNQVKVTMREVLLSLFDHQWKEHLLSMDYLKEGINWRAVGQKDPIVEYKRDAFELYEQMKEQVRQNVVRTIMAVQLYTEEEIEEIKREQKAQLEAQMQQHQARELAKRQQEERAMTNSGKRVGQQKVGRNDPCPCDSGKKFKHCHGK